MRSDKNRRNFEVFARKLSRTSHIWTQMLAEPSKFFGARATLGDSSCTVSHNETSVAPLIFDRSARKWISVSSKNGLKTSDFYPNSLLVGMRLAAIYCGVARPLIETNVMSYWRLALGGIPRRGTPTDPYARTGGTITLLRSPTHIPCKPTSKPGGN